MARRHELLMGKTKEILPPEGYRFIEYAKNADTGNSYINLPYGFDDTDTLEVKGGLSFVASGWESWLVGSKTWNNNTNRLGFFGMSASKFTFCFGNLGSPNSDTIPQLAADTDVHVMKYSNRLFEIIDLNAHCDVSNKLFGGTTDKLRLYYGYAQTRGKIYYFKQTKLNGDELYILPVENVETGTVEMYDTVSKTIMERVGTLSAPQE